ncbi:MAG: S-adenosylmethionine:tRNA ribosyltransferase-isomerase [Bacteroidaceae bacterium]|nr:S-adenosylmethionine:tRNA ribosyltransferase-isomerase [Bacteroidaceae bacterium]
MMNDPRHIQIADFNYPLPDERIAKFPLQERDRSKLLVYRKGQVTEDVFGSLPSYLPEGALMVFNNTRVIQARLHFRKETGALIEVFCLEPVSPSDYALMFQQQGRCSWLCLVGNLKKWKEGTLRRSIPMPNGEALVLGVTRGEARGDSFVMEFGWEWERTTETPLPAWAEVLEAVGELPIPPYLNRDTQESDLTTYQTVYSKIKGSVAAPTAGLHFTERVLKALDEHGIDREELTLHVGAGTFKPVKSKEIEGHEMHAEHVAVNRSTIEKLLAHGGEAIAVGTTSVRALESLYYMGVLAAENPDAPEDGLHVPQWMPYADTTQIPTVEALQALLAYMDRHELQVLHTSTRIIIAPGYTYRIVKMMVTNFHQPQSTLLLLVSAFVKGDWRTIYDYALAHGFRFLSYGDSSLLIP